MKYNETVIVNITSNIDTAVNVTIHNQTKSIDLTAGESKEVTFNDLDVNVDGYTVIVASNESENYTAYVNDSVVVKVLPGDSSVVITVSDGVFNTIDAEVEYNITNQTAVAFNITGVNFNASGSIVDLNDTLHICFLYISFLFFFLYFRK